MKIGFIGYGKMGSTIAQAILNCKTAQPNQLIIYNRTRPKLDELSTKYPEVTIAESPSEVAKDSDILFICTLTGTIPTFLKEAANAIRPGTHIILISGALDFQYLEKQFSGGITKTIPAVTLASGRGVTLVCHNSKVTAIQKTAFQALLGPSSRLVEVSEQTLDNGADFTSTFPAFIAKMMDTWAKVGADGSGYSKNEALELVLETLAGAAVLLADKDYTPEVVMDRVATKGGNTEQGLKVLDRELPKLFSEVFEATRKKRNESKLAMAKLVQK